MMVMMVIRVTIRSVGMMILTGVVELLPRRCHGFRVLQPQRQLAHRRGIHGGAGGRRPRRAEDILLLGCGTVALESQHLALGRRAPVGLQRVHHLFQPPPLLAGVPVVAISRRREGVVVRTGGRWRLGRARGRGCGVLHGALGHRHRGCAAPAAWAPYATYDTLGYHRITSHLVLKQANDGSVVIRECSRGVFLIGNYRKYVPRVREICRVCDFHRR